MKSWQDGKEKLITWVRAHPTLTGWSILIGIVLLLTLGVMQKPFSEPTRVPLFDSRRLTSDQIGKMQVAFSLSELNEYEIQGTQIFIPRQHRNSYLKACFEHGAIPDDFQDDAESFGSLNLFPTREQLRLQQIAKKKRTIRDMVLQLRFIDRAMVDYDETSGATAFDAMQRTAIVTVSPTDNRSLALSEVKAIRDTVRGAVAGLATEEITIIDAPGGKSYTGEIASIAQEEQLPAIQQNRAEIKYETKIRSALMTYPGIRVNAEVGIDSILSKTLNEQRVEGDPQIFRQKIERALTPGVPSTKPSLSFPDFFGLSSNGRGRVELLSDEDRIQTVETTESIANGTFETTIFSGPTITHVNVSIGIPERCLEYFVTQQEAAPELNREILREQIFEQLKQDIQQKVKPLLPGSELAIDSQIVVTLDREIPLPEAAMAGTLLTQNWPPQWPWLVGIGSGLVVLVLLRPWVRLSQKNTPSSSLDHVLESGQSQSNHTPLEPTPVTPRNQQSLMEGLGNAGPHFPISNSGESLAQPDSESALDTEKQLMRDQLDQWCRDNPNAAADTIQQWLSRKAG